jgi:CBS domain-containing protein
MDIFKTVDEELGSIHEVNSQHDNVIREIVNDVINNEMKQTDLLTTPSFSFFLMGSAGRYEQSKISDQDHGIVFRNESDLDFFRRVGDIVVDRLSDNGYPKCPGGVMCNKSTWGKSIEGWNIQIEHWIDENSLGTLRNLLIFLDSRHLIGESDLLYQLRNRLIDRINHDSKILNRLVDNTSRPKKSLGFFGQFVVENHGENSGLYEFKDNLLLLYINSIRILSLTYGVKETSTLSRLVAIFDQSSEQSFLKKIYSNFVHLLYIRYQNARQKKYGEDIYLEIKKLNDHHKMRLKQIIKDGYELNKYVTSEVRKRPR